jgi:hypothetical protein
MVYDRLPIRVTWLVFLLWMATIASQAQTYVQFSIQTPLSRFAVMRALRIFGMSYCPGRRVVFLCRYSMQIVLPSFLQDPDRKKRVGGLVGSLASALRTYAA